MGITYICGRDERKARISRDTTFKGIDFIEVLEDQHTISIHFVPSDPSLVKPPVPEGISADNVKITGGVRIMDVRVTGLSPGNSENIIDVNVADPLNLTQSVGDFSTYKLSLVGLSDLDPPLSSIDFSFKVACESPFDCKRKNECIPKIPKPPAIDYLCRDYASFRRLMLDRLAQTVPNWKERNPVDLGIAIAETLAYTADRLSYHQDAVATEAYLGTARKRTSVRRHARLLDYPMHDGSNSRIFVAVMAGPDADGAVLSGPSGRGSPGTAFLTRVDALGSRVTLDEESYADAVAAGAQVFEAMEEIILHADLNEIRFYTWGKDDCCLPRGSTRASLLDHITQTGERALSHLRPGSLLIFEEAKSPESGNREDRDPSRRHAVRLTGVQLSEDRLYDELVAEVEWSAEDALPFDMFISSMNGGRLIGDVSIALGNVLLADHGRTIQEVLSEPIGSEEYAPRLSSGPVSQQGRARDRLGRPVKRAGERQNLFDPRGPATRAFGWEMRDVLPAIILRDEIVDQLWLPKKDLLNSDRFSPDFLLEVEDEDAYLRFGDDITGMRPSRGMTAIYRIGNGQDGNIGAGAIAHIFTDVSGIQAATNPMPALGGIDPEPIEAVKIYAPQAFRLQERAVTEEDYANIARRHPDVQKAVATIRWTGSWYTIFIAVDRAGGRPVDREFEDELSSFMERFSLAGMDIEIEGPSFVPLDIRLTVCVDGDHFRSEVERDLYETFSSQDLTGGRRGFFHPDNLTFGEPVYLSRIIARAMGIPGVLYVDADEGRGNRFQRWGRASMGKIKEGVIKLGRLEIARLENDLNEPENGRIEFKMEGGL